MQEMWKDIQGYEGLYAVSSFGRVKSTKYDRVLKPKQGKTGYLRITLSKKNIPKTFLIHRLVAQSFFEDFNPKQEVNHKNGIKSDNQLTNLEMVSRSDNTIHKIYELNVCGGLLNDIRQIRCINTGVVFPSVRDAARSTGVHQSAISYCLTGKRHTAGGLKWEYC